MPFCHVRLKAPKPPAPAYPKSLKTLGGHIRKRRLDLHLLQSEVAKRLGVTESCIWNWENNATTPAFQYWPPIIEFLGYNPVPEPEELAGRLRWTRKGLGLSQVQLATRLGVDESTIAHWERGINRPTGLYRKLVSKFIADGKPALEVPASASEEDNFWFRELISARRRRGLTRAGLARKLGVSEHTLRCWERGDRKPHGLYRKLIVVFIGEPE
ncbi:MAG: helix-turn-helix domain-containing protein [Bryobacteraceae bacterium]|nr:helix-turn-helix domain-containing protein [Bryobacteraceae bacterium]